MADTCSVTQYVGARYVPLFAEPLDWDINVTYDPLTIVYYQGNSYTSRQYVPIGIDISNTDYWALTGNYNAQIEQYREEVQRFDERITVAQNTADSASSDASTALTTAQAAQNTASIAQNNADDALETAQAALETAEEADRTANTANTTANTANTTANTANTTASSALATANSALTTAQAAKNRTFTKMLFIGDSWGRGYYGGSDHLTSGIAQQLANFLDVDTLVNLSVNAVGWANSDGGNNFYQQYANATATQKEDVDIIVICGGQNDDTADDATNIWSNANSLFDSIAGDNPDAEVHVFPFPFSYGRTFGSDEDNLTIGNAYQTRCYAEVDKAICNTANKNVHVHKGCHRWGWKLGTIDTTYISDAYHLSATGYARFAGIMARCITEGGDYWPTMQDAIGDYNGSGTVRDDKVFEENGVIHVQCYIQATASNPIGTSFRLPGWCMGSNAKYFPGSATSSAGIFFAMDSQGSGIDCYVDMSLQGAAVSNGDWILINWSWPAGF